MSVNDFHLHTDVDRDFTLNPITKADDGMILANETREKCEICKATDAKAAKPVGTGKPTDKIIKE